MAKTCDICGKKPMVGHMVSHSNNATRRRFLPNIKKLKVGTKGAVKTITICMKCLKAGKGIA